jgi:tetratricopeptide (TPR) repeat protein
VELNFRLGREDQALSELDNFLAYLSDNNQKDQALAFMERLAEEYPDRVHVRRRLADLYQYLDRIGDAVAQLDAIGELLLEAGDRPGAIQAVEMILGLDPPNKTDYELLLVQIQEGGD